MLPVKSIRFIKGIGNINICVTPNGTEVTKTAMGYCTINKNSNVNKNKWYVGSENGFEIWQREKMFNDGYRIVESKVKISA